MAGKKPASCEEPRGKTDQSLKDERGKTDKFLEQDVKSVEDETEETIRQARLAADKEVESQRAQEDRARAQEHSQKHRIVEAYLDRERKQTDHNIVDERGRADLELATRDQFLAIVSHDLRNSIHAISLAARALRSDVSTGKVDTADLAKGLQAIDEVTASMDRMVIDLLDAERMAHDNLPLEPERVDARVLIQECVDLFTPIISARSFSMTIDIPPEPLFADMDPDRILQVLSNLVGNSLKFTPNGGTIELSVRQQDSHVEISVTDNGPGIPELIQTQIFERFSQLKLQQRRGIGLGLFIAKWIVEAHEGRIWVTSDSRTGSTFSFTLPLSAS